MNWLQDNPVGRVLAAIGGVFVLFALVMAVVWTVPVAVEKAGLDTTERTGPDTVLVARKLAGLGELQVINQRPVFNESRLPVVEEPEEPEVVEDVSVAVKDAPDVRLTGVVITPEMKIATLTPADGELENVMAHEGQSLVGEFVGWHVGEVSPRTVVLRSSDGQRLELDLQVHDTAIKEPPKPVMPAAVAETRPGQDGQTLGEDGQPLSRAEQIRQRIAERREELRLEQEQNQQEQTKRARTGSVYQQAIRNMMNKNRKDESSDDNKDG